MKKVISIVLIFTVLLTLSACSKKIPSSENLNDVVNEEFFSDSDAGNNVEISEETKDDVSEEASSDVQWKQFIKEYEEWVDKYIEITKKYKANPSDMSILSDYTEMMTELAEWSTKTEEIEKELESASASELAEYSAELARIAAKIAQAAY